MESSTTPSRNDEAVLLLYLADELSPQQKQGIETRLANDPSFAAALNRLRDVDAWLSDSFDELDKSQPLPGTPGSWQRRIGRMIRQWQARQAAMANANPLPGRRIGSWAYVAAAVALVIIGYTAYWGFQSDKPMLAINPAVTQDPQIDQGPPPAPSDPILDYDARGLADAEREIGDLSDLRTSF